MWIGAGRAAFEVAGDNGILHGRSCVLIQVGGDNWQLWLVMEWVGITIAKHTLIYIEVKTNMVNKLLNFII